MGRPAGSANKDKPFRDALRAEIAAAQDENDFRSLRKIARGLLTAAAEGKIDAIREIADRVDGKPAQESTVTIDDKRDATDWTRDELVAFLRNAVPDSQGTAETERRGGKPDRVH